MAAPKLIDTDYEGPQKIDRYDLVAEIASGGMATVYLARLSGVGGFRRFVAIKRLHPHLAKEKEFVEMFLDEARLAAGIHHPNVVPILEVGASSRGYYLVMEYIEGDTLARLLARAATSGNRLPTDIGIRIGIDMLSGLHAAHELRDEHDNPTELVHRDVSPQNVLVGVDGNTRITDFGVARAASRLSATRAGQLKGKIAYMAPEQATGDPTVDRRADVFSAGIVLWEVAAARRLFKAENEAATLSRVISEQVPDIREVNPDLDDAVAAALMKALERDPDARHQTCAEFADDLERAAQIAGQLPATRDVATYVGDVMGNEIAQQREAVRGWLARSEPSQAIPEVDMPKTTPPPLPGAAEQSGMISATGPAPLGGDPPVATGRRANPAVVAGIAAVLGFLGVGAYFTLGAGEEVTVAPAPPATPIPTAAPAPATPPAAEDEPEDPADEEVKAESDDEEAEPKADEEDSDDLAEAAKKAKTAKKAPGARKWKPRRVAPAPEPAEPKPKPAGDIDLSNPYR